MKDAVQWVLVQIPKYVSNFYILFVSPKRFVGARNMSDEKSLAEAFTFLAVSFIFALLFHIPLMPDDVNLLKFLGVQGVANLLWVVFAAAGLRLAWKCMGGRAQFTSFLITYCYYFGVTLVLIKILHLFVLGIFKTFYPDVYEALKYLLLGVMAELAEDLPVFPFLVVFGGYIAVGIWLFLGWGAYRELNGLTKIRSFGAGMLFILVSGVLLAFLSIMLNAVTQNDS